MEIKLMLLIIGLVLVIGILCIVCFFVGAKVGQKVVRQETITLPNLNPMKAIEEHREKQETNKENEKKETIWKNLERYDGTSAGQEDVPM